MPGDRAVTPRTAAGQPPARGPDDRATAGPSVKLQMARVANSRSRDLSNVPVFARDVPSALRVAPRSRSREGGCGSGVGGQRHATPFFGGPTIRPTRPVVQRTCACGGKAGPDGECEACRAKRLQRRAAGPGPATAPPLVHDVLRSGVLRSTRKPARVSSLPTAISVTSGSMRTGGRRTPCGP